MFRFCVRSSGFVQTDTVCSSGIIRIVILQRVVFPSAHFTDVKKEKYALSTYRAQTLFVIGINHGLLSSRI